MVRTLRRMLTAGALALFAAAPAARAEFDIEIISSTTGPIFINVTDAINTSLDPNVISVDVGALNASLAGAGAGFTFSSLSLDKTPNGSTSQLAVVGQVSSTGYVGSVTVIGSAVDYSTPGPGPAILASTASDSFNGGGFGGRSFNSYLDTANIEFATMGPTVTATGPLVFAGSPVLGSDNGTATPAGVIITGPFSLTNVTVVSLTASGASDLFTGVTTVTAVPEPGSMALLLIGGTALAARLRRRKVEA